MLSADASSPASPTLQVIDYGGGNIGSLMRCLDRLGLAYTLVNHGDQLRDDRLMLLPGVGAFGAVMRSLHERGFVEPLRRLAGQQGVPLMGICVGQQVLFEGSEETPGVEGLGLLPGHVRRLQGKKVPQIGWNALRRAQPDAPLSPQGTVYFVNSYVAQPAMADDTLYEAVFEGQPFCAAVRRHTPTVRLLAFQFHPEKSGQFGHDLLSEAIGSLRA